MSSQFGHLFRISTFGESHGVGVGVVIDGCPPGFKLDIEAIQNELDRRKPGQSKIVTQRKESDQVEVLSGLSSDGLTLGTPIAMMVRNSDARSRDYDDMKDKYRPSHADFTYDEKYGLRAWEGGGRASARETIGRVAAGAVAKQILKEQFGVQILAWVERVKDISAQINPERVTLELIEANIVRCPDSATAEKMIALIEETRKAGDTVGGVIRGYCTGVPAGWGEPVFDKLEADLAKAMMSLPASKGFTIGSGFEGTYLTGHEHNDPFHADANKVVSTPTNYSGGIQGGITNGMPIDFEVAFKPVATIMHEQDTVNRDRENVKISGKGRHDPCVLPRAVPMVEAMTALVLVDHALRQRALRID
ncbi:MAG: chorismate synthase [Armatimonadetes bacterium]|nr:chorismate synthase [Armatimonadota bacterium]